jgi:hypothetical protein
MEIVEMQKPYNWADARKVPNDCHPSYRSCNSGKFNVVVSRLIYGHHQMLDWIFLSTL